MPGTKLPKEGYGCGLDQCLESGLNLNLNPNFFAMLNEFVTDELLVHGHPYVSIQLFDGCFNTATLYGQGQLFLGENGCRAVVRAQPTAENL